MVIRWWSRAVVQNRRMDTPRRTMFWWMATRRRCWKRGTPGSKAIVGSGIIVVSVAIDTYSKQLAANPELITRGFIYVKENGPLINDATEVVYETIERCRNRDSMDLSSLKSAIRDDLRGYIYRKTRRSPVILPVILYV